MTSKLLQRVGVFAVIALIVGSFAALAVVRNRIQISVADEVAATRRGADPMVVLSADLAAAREEVRGLGEGFGPQIQALHDALEESAAERDLRLAADLTSIRRELADLRARVDLRAGAEEQRLRERAEEQPTALAASSPRVEVAIAEPAPDHAPALEPSETSIVQPAAAPTAAKKSFLSFTLPSHAFTFDQHQRFAIVPSLSRIGFDAKSTLHDFSGVTTKVDGEFTVNLAHPGDRCSGTVRAETSSLDTGLAGRDEAMREILEPAKYPELRFDWTAFESADVDATAQKVTGIARGNLSIHGVAREIAMPVTVAVDASKRLAIDGQATIRLSDFGVEPPSKLGVISVEDEAVLWIALRARLLGPAPLEKP